MVSTLEEKKSDKNFIEYESYLILGGAKATSERVSEVISPFSGKVIGQTQIPNPDQIEIALQQVQNGFEIISKLSPLQRANILEKASLLILENSEELAKLICLEIGKPIKQARLEIKRTADIFKLSAEEALRINGEIIPLSRQEQNHKKLATFGYEPLGPVLAITPFNFPASTLAHKVAPAIAAGNSIILKPSPFASIIAYNLVKILLKANLPPEAICLLNCSNTQTERMVQDYRLKFISFTGNSNTGWHLRSLAHPGTKLTLELGGNSPVIIHEDADLNKVIPACLRGSFAFSGQSCISVQRIYFHEKIAAEFMAEFLEATEALSVGDPTDENIDIGPLINDSAVRRIHLWTEEATSEGSQLITGGKILNNNCYEPTILHGTKPKMHIVSSEAFGPIVNLTSYQEIETAIKLANDTSYGLSAAIFTQNIDLAFRTAKALKAGSVMINDSSAFRADEMPTGSYNQSGIGLESPHYVIREMSQSKLTCLNLS